MHAIYEAEAVNKLYQYLGKVVCITLSNKRTVSGTVYTIDPVSQNVALLQSESGCLELIMGHAVMSIVECPDQVPADLSRVLPSNLTTESGSNLEAVKSWLQKNRISVEEGEKGQLVVGGAVLLRPPYTPQMCTGDNELVVERVREVLKKMPC